MRSLSDEQLERTVAEVLEELHETHLTYDEKRASFGCFLDAFKLKTEIYKHKNRAWTDKLRKVVRRVLGRQALASMVLRVEATKVRLDHASLRTVIADALKRFDLRLESVSTKEVREIVCHMLGISTEQLREGLRYAVLGACPQEGGEGSDVSAAHDFTKLMLSVYMDLSDLAWHSFLFDASPDAGGCCARRKSGRLACAVLFKCGGAVREASQASGELPLCSQHFAEWKRAKGKLRLGIWSDAGNSVDDLHPNTAAALVKDLKQRGMLDEVLVHWGGEIGRLPVTQNQGAPEKHGRDHNGQGFSTWLAGGGIKPGMVHGATDDLGHRAVENVVTPNDYQATLMHLFGLQWDKLVFDHSGREEIITAGRNAKVVKQILS